MYDYCVTVLTPTYNRKKLLPRLFNSLCLQTRQNFQWLVIDDGSTDNTVAFFDHLPKHNFEIDFHRKENGGKHTALNYSHPFIKGELVIILDSDDYLLPEAIETIEKDWFEYRSNNAICGMSYQRCNSAGVLVGEEDEMDVSISDHILYRINQGRGGDRCEVLRSVLLEKYTFPVFEKERFMSEGWLWNNVAYKYQTVYRNKALYVCDYLEDGLTKSGRTLRMQCPLGMMENCKTFFHPKVNVKVQIKEMWLFIVYGKCAGFSLPEIARQSGRPIRILINIPFGLVLYYYWGKKYLKKRNSN